MTSPLRTFVASSPRTAAWSLIALWVLSYAAVKLAGLQGLDVDSAEQVYFAQSWQWGYGTRQPPLYTWLLKGLQPQAWSWPGALELMRYGLLLGWLLAVQALARACGAGPALQAACLLAHLGLGLALWRVHDSLTHTVLAVVLGTAGSAAVVRAVTHSPRWWLLAGLLAGLSCLAKFNALLWWLSAGAAAWWLAWGGAPQWRRTVAWSLGGAAVSAAVVLPYGLWWWAQRTAAGTLVRQIAVSREDAPWWRPALDVAAGAVEFAALAPLLLALLGAASAWWGRGASQKAAAPPAAAGGLHRLALRWLIAQNLLALLGTMAVVTLAQGTEFKARWLWPVLPGLAVALVLVSGEAVTRRGGVWPRRWHRTAAVVALGAVLLSLLRWWEPELNARRCRECWTDRPAAEAARALRQAHGPSLRILAGDPHLAGVLAAADARLLTYAPGLSTVPPPAGFTATSTPCVAAWIDMDQPQPAPSSLPPGAEGAPANAAVRKWSWPLRHAPGRRAWLQSYPLPAAACATAALGSGHPLLP